MTLLWGFAIFVGLAVGLSYLVLVIAFWPPPPRSYGRHL